MLKDMLGTVKRHHFILCRDIYCTGVKAAQEIEYLLKRSYVWMTENMFGGKLFDIKHLGLWSCAGRKTIEEDLDVYDYHRGSQRPLPELFSFFRPTIELTISPTF